VAQRAGAPRVTGHDPADRGRVARAEVQAGVLVGGARRLLQGGQGRPCSDRQLAGRRVDLPDLVQALHRDDHLSVARDACADQPGVAALRHHRGALPGADRHHCGDLLGVGRPHHQARLARVASGVVALVGGLQLRVAQDVPGADDVGEGVLKVHGG
jgi:hypothetical protein